MNSDFKLIAGVVGGSLLLLVLAVFGFGKLAQQDAAKGEVRKEIVVENRLIKGAENPKVTVIEYSDFQCPACRAVFPLVKQLESKEGVAVVYRHLPLSNIHKYAQIGAEAAEAAADQGKFWEYHDILFERQDQWSTSSDVNGTLVEYAKELGLDADRFARDLEERKFKDVVLGDSQEGLRLGVKGTPTFFVNGIEASSVELMALVEQELAL